MLRRELVTGIKNIISVFQKPEFKILTQESGKIRRADIILDAYRHFITSYEKFSELEKKILRIYELESFFDTKIWSISIMDEEEKMRGPDEFRWVLAKANNAIQNLSSWLPLIEQKSKNEIIFVNKKKRGVKILSVITIEDEILSTPNRLVYVLESIQGFYSVSAELSGSDSNTLSVLTCDSGSDKSFDFLGVDKLIEMVKEIIITFWNKLVFYKEEKTGKELELIANSLPIIEKIALLKENGSLEPEKAELLKRQVIDSVNKFAKSGSTIPEIENYTLINPRQLLKPEQKLLVAHMDSDTKNDVKTVNSSSKKKRKKYN